MNNSKIHNVFHIPVSHEEARMSEIWLFANVH